MRSLSRLGLAALSYSQEYGWPVFPLHDHLAGRGCSCLSAQCERVAKHPRIDTGFKGASTHPEQICDWWDRWPRANIGFSPGTMDLLVLDTDSDRGEAALGALGVLDIATLEVITRKGRHRYFRIPKGLTISNSSPWKRDGHQEDIDVRAHGGFVILPPSVHESGHVYAWRGELE